MALSADATREIYTAPRYEYPVLAATTIYNGALVCIDSTGYAIPAALTASNKVVGLARAKADNASGADGAIDVLVHAGLAVWLTNDSTHAVDQADLGGACYVHDDTTVRDFVSGGVNVVAGAVVAIDSTKGVLVWIGFPQDAIGAITGNLAVSGNLSAGGTFGVTGASTFTGAVDFDGGATMATATAITGDAELALAVTGAVDCTVTLGNDLATSSFVVENNSAVAILQVDGDSDVTVTGDLDVTVNGTVGGTLGVTGLLTATGGVSVVAGEDITGAGALEIGVATGAFDLTVNMGDDAGAQSVLFTNASDATVASVNSLGQGIFAGGVDCNDFVATDATTLTTTGAPSQANMVTAFGAAAAHAGEIWMLFDDAGGTGYYRCYSDGTNWWYNAFTVGA